MRHLITGVRPVSLLKFSYGNCCQIGRYVRHLHRSAGRISDCQTASGFCRQVCGADRDCAVVGKNRRVLCPQRGRACGNTAVGAFVIRNRIALGLHRVALDVLGVCHPVYVNCHGKFFSGREWGQEIKNPARMAGVSFGRSCPTPSKHCFFYFVKLFFQLHPRSLHHASKPSEKSSRTRSSDIAR